MALIIQRRIKTEVLKRGGMWPRNQKRISKNHWARRRSLSRRRIVPVTLMLRTYERSVTITRNVRDAELATWKETRGRAGRIWAKAARRRKKSVAYGKFSLSPTVYQCCIMLKTPQNITSDSEFTAYLVDVAEAFDKTSQSR